MFSKLTENLNKIFDKLTSKGIINEDDVNSSMREVRIALLEADVALSVVKELINKVKEAAIGQSVIKSISPGQMIIKIVQEELTKILGVEEELNLAVKPPAVIMMVGLQGAGKTTMTAKLALKLKADLNKKILLASLDIYRPAAQEQLAILATQADVDSLPIIKGESPIAITKRALQKAQSENFDILILDTAGRLHINEELMEELVDVHALSKPIETMLIVDAMTGQDAVNIANKFKEKLPISSISLTRLDGDSRGGAALSMAFVTGCPIKYIGVGEKITEIEKFHPDRLAQRILGMGDIVSLVEKAAKIADEEEAKKIAAKIKKGKFDLDDMLAQMKNIKKIGGFSGILDLLPGIGRIREQINQAGIDEKMIARQEAIILSMTKLERQNYKIINASRKIRIAKGAGVKVQDVNVLLKRYADMLIMMKKFGSMDKKSLMRSGIKNLFG